MYICFVSTFIKHPEGETIRPYEFDVHIPPVGYVWDYFKGEFAPRPIYSRSEVDKDQYWERPINFLDYENKRAIEKRKQKDNSLFVDPELESFREQEWDRRINGFWFMNNGKATYITGTHYFYLTWWRIDIGYPSYRESDRNFFYMWRYCEDDPYSFGLVEAARRRSGKALYIETEIPTPNGFVKMKNLKVGDYVFDAYGKPVIIEDKSDIFYDHDCYRVTFNDGSYLIADGDHQWEVTTKRDRKKYGLNNAPKKVLSTNELLDGGLTYLKKELNYQVDITKPVEYKESDLVISPYLFGVWLGDGHTSSPIFTSLDEEIINSFSDEYDISNCYGTSYYIHKSKYDGETFSDKLNKLEFRKKYNSKGSLIKQESKYIPEQYKTASVEQRLELLRGIIDSDGYIGKKGHMELICANNERLANDYMELIRSLGIRATMKSSMAVLYGKDCGTRYRIYINTDQDIFKLSRKRDKQFLVNRSQENHLKLRIKSIEKVDTVPTQCISVRSERGVYLAGRDYIVTHNSARGTCVLFEYTSRAIESNSGIQSKTRIDASKVFSKLINSFRALPDFFKPVYDDSAGTRPKNVLTFIERSKKGEESEDFRDELVGRIDFQSTEMLAYDGMKLHRYMLDECGKFKDIDVGVLWAVVRECLTQGSKTIIGKAYATTTVEEGGSAHFRKLWNDSDFNEKDAKTGRTRSGLYRTFTPAYQNDDDFIDMYGVCDEVAAKESMQDQRSAYAADNKLLAEYTRKYPFTVDEAFFSINERCIFDSLIINNQIKMLSFKSKSDWFLTGNFSWEDGIGSDVVFHENTNGRWRIHRKYLELDEKIGLSNQWERRGDLFKPLADNICITGADTFDHSLKNLADQSRASNAAFYTYYRHDPYAPELDDTFVCEYVHRQPTADMMSEDLMMQCVFFGSPVIIENQKPGAIHFFTRNGYKGFLVKADGTKEGISASMKNKQSLAEVTEAYVRDNCDKVVFESLLMDWNDFTLENSTKNDSTMGAGWALLIATRIGKKFQEKPKHIQSHQPAPRINYSKFL